MTLESSAVIFQALKPLQPHWPHRPLRPRWPLQPQKPYFTKELPDSDGWIILGTKMTNNCHFLWNSSSKIQFFTDFSTFSAGGCWGQPMLLFWKLGQETQMSTPPEATRHHISTQLLVLLHLRAIYFSTFQYETPCMSEKLDFWWSIPQNGTGIGHWVLGIIQPSGWVFFWGNEAVEVTEVIEVVEAVGVVEAADA